MLETVWANPLAIDKFLPELRAFYEEYLIEREQPNCMKYLEEKRQQVRCEGQVDRYLMIAEQIKELEAEKKRLLDEIVKLADGKDSEINGHKLTKVIRAGSISYAKAVKDLMPDVDLTEYTGEPSSYWLLK
jgi:chromosome segregation ATPase